MRKNDLRHLSFIQESASKTPLLSIPILTDFISPASLVGSPIDVFFTLICIALAGFCFIKAESLFRFKGLITTTGFLLTLRYLAWRWIYTLNHNSTLSLAASTLFFFTELFSLLGLWLLYFRNTHTSSPDPIKQRNTHFPSIDILIKDTEQNPDTLYRTLVCVQAMDYPAESIQIIIVGEGKKTSKALAKRFGCAYLTSAAIETTGTVQLHEGSKGSDTGELLMILNAGDAPISTCLSTLIPFFEDPKIAFVQAGIYTLTSDPFQQALFLEKEIPHERDLFFKILAPGLKKHHATIPAKNGVIYRRLALNEIPALKEDESITRFDLALSARLYSKGWHSEYVNHHLILETRIESAAAYFKERAGRLKTALHLLRKGLPLWPKITLGQRLGYLSFLVNDLRVLPRLLFLMAPLFFLFGLPLISAPLPQLLIYFVPFYLFQEISCYTLTKRSRHPIWSSVYETADIAAGRFEQPTKGQRIKQFFSIPIFPFILIGIILLFGLVISIFLYTTGYISGQDLLIGGLWSFYNLLLLTAAAAAVRGHADIRAHTRMFRETKLQVLSGTKHWEASLVKISEKGVSAKMSDALNLPKTVGVSLGEKDTFTLKGKMVRNDVHPSGGFLIGIQFLLASEAERKKLICWLFSEPHAWGKGLEVHHTHTAGLLGLFTTVGRILSDEKDLQRAEPRYVADLKGRLLLNDDVLSCRTIDVSRTGVAIRVHDEPGPLADALSLECFVNNRALTLSGRAIWSRQKAGQWEIGIHLGAAEGKRLFQAVLPQAQLKIELRPSLQTRSLRTMGRVFAFMCSLITIELVIGFFLRQGILPPISGPLLDTTFHFFWLSIFLILSDGLKTYFEITGRGPIRQCSSDLSEVTAVIACHNTGKPIVHTIEAATSMLANERVIVVDDASTDDTAAIAKTTSAHLVSLKKNRGKVGALTVGLEHVKTKYVLILDDDTRLKNIFLPTSLLEEGFSGVAFNVLPCRRTRESSGGKNLITCIQRYEYAKSMEIGRRFLDKTGSVSCISGALGLFQTKLLREVQSAHTNIFPGEDLERTLILFLKYKARIAFANEIVWTVAPDSLKSLSWQRLMRWYPAYYRLMGVFFKIMINRELPARLRFEMFYNIYVVLTDPIKVTSLFVLIIKGYWGGLAFLYLFYLALEIYPFLTIDKKLPVLKYYIPTFFIYPLYGIYNAFLRTASFFPWLWNRYVTKIWKPINRERIN